jgi:hypothetical protein
MPRSAKNTYVCFFSILLIEPPNTRSSLRAISNSGSNSFLGKESHAIEAGRSYASEAHRSLASRTTAGLIFFDDGVLSAICHTASSDGKNQPVIITGGTAF